MKHYEWKLFDVASDEQQAGGMSDVLEDAQRDARHYTMMYSQDGMVRCELYEVRVVDCWNAGEYSKEL